jgi:hypothetical protein
MLSRGEYAFSKAGLVWARASKEKLRITNQATSTQLIDRRHLSLEVFV